MLKLIVKAFLITVVLMVASLVFADEAILSALILLTISLTAVSLVLGQATPPDQADIGHNTAG